MEKIIIERIEVDKSRRITKDGWEIYNVPENGWKLEEINKIANELCHDVVVFASPIPALMKDLTSYMSRTWHVFHNDNRVKKELPNGKIIMTVSPTGWTIV